MNSTYNEKQFEKILSRCLPIALIYGFISVEIIMEIEAKPLGSGNRITWRPQSCDLWGYLGRLTRRSM